MRKVQLRKPYFPEDLQDKVLEDIRDVMVSGRLTLGPRLKEFEESFASKIGSRHAVGVTSATAGLHLSMIALGIGRGDEVVVPAKTFVATANAAVYCGARPSFCDVRADTMNMDSESLRKAVANRTKAVIPVHIAGQPCDMDEIREFCDTKSLEVVEDSAHAPHALYKGKFAGTIGKIGVFSFYPDKVIASCDGGMMVTDDDAIHENLLLLRNCGRKGLGDPDVQSIGYNYRMNELQAVLGLRQLEVIDQMLQRRLELAKLYDERLAGVKGIETPVLASDRTHNYYAYVVSVTGVGREKFRRELASRGIETSLMFKPVYLHKPYREMGYPRGLCPVSERISRTTVSIPLHSGLATDDAEYVCNSIADVLA